jgi:hypothetical protein
LVNPSGNGSRGDVVSVRGHPTRRCIIRVADSVIQGAGKSRPRAAARTPGSRPVSPGNRGPAGSTCQGADAVPLA